MDTSNFPTRVTASDQPEKPPGPPDDEGPLLHDENVPRQFLPGYRFLNSLSRNPLSECWLVQAPNGARQQARVITGFLDAEPKGTGRDPLERLRFLIHDGLIPFQVVHREPGRAVLIGDLPDQTLRDRFFESQARKFSSIPRDELLSYLHSVATTLDALAKQHNLFHLGLNANNVILDRGQAKLADFGLIHWLWWPAGQPIAQINLRYSAPELFEGEGGRMADQYSLALLYCEMLTGAHPLHGQPRPRVLGERFRCKPDLRLLSRFDRDVIARALNADYRHRFPSCLAFIQSLSNGPGIHGDKPSGLRSPRALLWPPVIPWPPADHPAQSPLEAARGVILDDVIPGLIARAAAGGQLQHKKNLHYVLQPGDLLEHRCAARLPKGVARLKLGGFIDQWKAVVVQESADQFVLRVSMRGSFWQRCMGSVPGIEVQIRLLPQRRWAMLTEVNIAIRPIHCEREQATSLLQKAGPDMLVSLRDFLQAYPEQRHGQRLDWAVLAHVWQIPIDRQPRDILNGKVKDLSLTGIGFLLPEAPTSQMVYLNLETPETESLGLLAKIVRVRPRNDGWYEIGARFDGFATAGTLGT